MPRVLIVDDQGHVRDLLRIVLEREGCRVWQAADGFEAVELYATYQEEIACVLLDVCMPGRDGPETLAVLRELEPALPCAFISGYTGEYSEQDLLNCGAEFVLRKPFRLADFGRVLRCLAGLSTATA